VLFLLRITEYEQIGGGGEAQNFLGPRGVKYLNTGLATQASTKLICWREGWAVMLATYLHIVSRLRMGGTILYSPIRLHGLQRTSLPFTFAFVAVNNMPYCLCSAGLRSKEMYALPHNSRYFAHFSSNDHQNCNAYGKSEQGIKFASSTAVFALINV
jgi:hypothetical protein